MNGYLLIDKPVGWTSRDVCNKVQHFFHVDKVGHGGTLDPFATGLLIICLGSATKTISLLEDSQKEYIAELTLGLQTDTGDLTGETIKECPVPSISEEEIASLFKSMIGESEQIPPMTSAVHVNGRKLYTYHYRGESVERKPRKIVINSLDLVSFSSQIITFRAVVSKGTYIRTLGEDIAYKLQTVGHLTSLRRVGVADFKIEEAITLEQLAPDKVKSIVEVLSDFVPKIVCNPRQLHEAEHGMKIHFDDKREDSSKILLVNDVNDPIAIYGSEDGYEFTCVRGLK